MNTEQRRAANLPPEEKRALLARLLREKAERPQAHPVSFGQQRLWFLDRLEPGTIGYVMPAALRLKGALDVDALKKSFDEVVRRHAVLRTTLSDVDGEPRQFVHPPAPVEPTERDLSALEEDARERAAMDIVMEAVRRPFDLEQGPLCRMVLLRLADEDHIILINLHHIVTDGWSTAILVRELAALYKAALDGRSSPLPELPIQYTDYARWQRTWLEGDGFKAEIDYWRKQLGGQLPKLELQTDYPRPAQQNYRGAGCARLIDRRMTEALSRLSRSEGATLFMTLLAAFKTLLYRHTGQEDLVLGTAVSGRQRAETEPLIGFFVNTLVLRTDISGGPTFIDVLRRVKTVSLGALANQSAPFEKLVEELKPERSAGKNPLFEILFNYGNMPRATASLEGLSLSLIELADAQAKHAVTLYADEMDDRIALSLVYQRALFSVERMEAVLAQYVYLLEQIVEAPDTSIDEYSLCAPETRDLLPDPCAPMTAPPVEPVTDMVRRWAVHTPEAPAVDQLGRALSYGRLQELADRISRRLAGEGLRPGDAVAVLGPRSVGLIAGIIAVMQSGGVLLLIDRTHPEKRRRQLLAEGGARQILDVRENDRVEVDPGDLAPLPVIGIDAADGSPLGETDPDAPLPAFRPGTDDPAYICFTSGSTGVPKGVLGTHRGLSHFIAWERDAFAVGPADRVAQLSRLSFDVAMRDIFLPLASGATLCLPPDQTRFDTSQILDWLESQSISLVHIVPAVAAASLASLSPDVRLRRLRWALFAGEALTDQLVRRWRGAFPESGDIANLYGPTETTLAKFWHPVPDPPWTGVQPVGRPLPGAQGLVVNKAGRPCGLCEPGEIVIRTPYRSLGYINADDAASGKFVVNPYRDDHEDILYYTGDRGAYRADGLLEVRGRLDHQVKIRGVRIELGEIQSVVAAHPDVDACVAAVKGEPDDDPRLVAYITAKPGRSLSIASLRALVRRELPKHHHPSHFVPLEKMPLLPNGKIDRKALPAPGTDRPDTENPYVAPRNDMERTLCRIWEDVLKVSPIGVHDDFFDLGGHSLLAVRLMAQIKKATGVSLPLATLFEDGAVEKLAPRLMDPSDRASGALVAIQPAGRERPLFFVHPAGGNVLCYAGLADRMGADRPFYGLQASGFDSERPPPDRIEEMAAQYLEAVVGAQPSGPYLLGGWSMGAIVAYEMAQQLVRRGQEVAFLALLDHMPPAPGDAGETLDEVSVMRRFLDGAVEADAASFESMSAEQRIAFFLRHAKRLNLIPPSVGEAEVRSYLKVYTANVQAVRRYSPRPYPGRVTLLRTKFDLPGTDETLGWGALARGGVDVFEVPGAHHEMVSEPHVSVLAQLLKDCLARVEGAG